MGRETRGRPCASWRGQDRIGSAIVSSLTIIFRTGGCSWSRCLMCAYRHERQESADPEEILTDLRLQLRHVIHEHEGAEFDLLKIYSSGSLFDPAEVPLPFLQDIARAFRGKTIIAETRPEYVREDLIGPFISAIDRGSGPVPLYVAMGVETADDWIREHSINKGFAFRDVTRAAETARSAGAGVKAYLLHKPPFLTEREALEDMVSSIHALIPHADLISMNPCTVQRGTPLEACWRAGGYRPPYLWSVLSILSSAPCFISCDPLGGGYPRGPHNCGTCDRAIIHGIRDYSLSGDRDLITALLDLECSCKGEWEYVIAHERPYCMPLTR